jgi:Ser-tRNA(Ala) deacylase AlaX
MENHTRLVYLEDMGLLELQAQVLAVSEEEGKTIVILDQTIFYPQGGGQPYDQGYIRTDSGVFRVEEVRFVEGVVKHMGKFESDAFNVGDTVQCQVDGERRSLHARLHSGGHVIDLAIQQLDISWVPGKGYHFPQGPYIEYSGNLEDAGDIESFKKKLEEKTNEIIQKNDPVTIRFMEKEKMHEVCHHVPDYLPPNKPTRVVMYGSAGIPCGGTHVNNLAAIGQVIIRKVKKEKDAIRVSYEAAKI